MPRATRKPPPAVTLASVEDVEAAFYDALRKGDIDALMACWADDDDVVCVHPGGPRLVGTAAIRASFGEMFTHGTVQASPEAVRQVQSLSCAIHSVLERVSVLTNEGPREAYVIATNVFLKTPQGWRMVAHHASPGTPAELQEAAGGAGAMLH
jgi:ketosteroid isomerase-like protein